MDLFGDDKNKITGKKCQPVMSVTGLNDQGHNKIFILILKVNLSILVT